MGIRWEVDFKEGAGCVKVEVTEGTPGAKDVANEWMVVPVIHT